MVQTHCFQSPSQRPSQYTELQLDMWSLGSTLQETNVFVGTIPFLNIPSKQKHQSCYTNVSSRQGADPDFPCKPLPFRNCTHHRLFWPWWSLSHWEISCSTSTPCTSPKRMLLNPYLVQAFPVSWKSGWDKGSFRAKWGRLRGRAAGSKQGKRRHQTHPASRTTVLWAKAGQGRRRLAKPNQTDTQPDRRPSDAWERLVHLPRAWAMLFPGAKQVTKDESWWLNVWGWVGGPARRWGVARWKGRRGGGLAGFAQTHLFIFPDWKKLFGLCTFAESHGIYYASWLDRFLSVIQLNAACIFQSQSWTDRGGSSSPTLCSKTQHEWLKKPGPHG